ncbi:MAG: ABC transporter ATP-binding protein [Chloroflexi bacterium]|nr:ABC transporter ATP-binding protein [Chloroflexota bacterium]
MSEPLLCAQQVQMTFPEESAPFEALARADMCLYPQEIICIIGPSGCGKSTLLRILGGLLQPTGGRVILRGSVITAPQREIGFVFQRPALMPWRTVLANIMLPLEVAGVPRREAQERARAQLHLVGLDDFAHAYPAELSGGMSQRVAVARAMVNDPSILLLDEPFAALDALTRERMDAELLKLVQRQHKSVVMVTHNIQEAVLLSDRVLTMSARPGVLKNEVRIDLPRPRHIEQQHSLRFQELAAELRSSLSA